MGTGGILKQVGELHSLLCSLPTSIVHRDLQLASLHFDHAPDVIIGSAQGGITAFEVKDYVQRPPGRSTVGKTLSSFLMHYAAWKRLPELRLAASANRQNAFREALHEGPSYPPIAHGWDLLDSRRGQQDQHTGIMSATPSAFRRQSRSVHTSPPPRRVDTPEPRRSDPCATKVAFWQAVEHAYRSIVEFLRDKLQQLLDGAPLQVPDDAPPPRDTSPCGVIRLASPIVPRAPHSSQVPDGSQLSLAT
jgi:hypothetical protein